MTFHGELRQYPSLHLQNAGFAISSAEKRSIHRTEFDENDPISSLWIARLERQKMCHIKKRFQHLTFALCRVHMGDFNEKNEASDHL